MIELQNVVKKFDTRGECIEAVNGVSLKIKDGDIYGIIGLSGAGKSTLVRCLNYLEVPTSGKVIVDGVDLGALSKKEILKKRQSIGMVFQNFNLFEQRTVIENIYYPMEIMGTNKRQSLLRAYNLLEMVGLLDKAGWYPTKLSGGQKQRVAIARALATKPKVLLCDEATSALDPKTTDSILELLKNVNKTLGITIVVITHQMSVVQKICNRVAVMDKGRVVEEGYTKEVFISPKSDIAKSLIMTNNSEMDLKAGGKLLRLVFDGKMTNVPLISELTLECCAAVNIVSADTEDINGKCFGQMIIQLPEDKVAVERIYRFLGRNNVVYEEVESCILTQC